MMKEERGVPFTTDYLISRLAEEGKTRTFNVEVPKEPEYPGAPFDDELLGNVWIPELPLLNERMNREGITEDEKVQISVEIAQKYNEAKMRGRWKGPVNRREVKTLEITAPVSDAEEPPTPPAPEPEPEPEPTPVPPFNEVPPAPVPEPEEKNWFKRVGKKIKKGVEDFSEYTNRHRTESKVLALMGGLAGATSAIGGAVAAEYVATMALPALIGGPLGLAAGIGTALLINHFAFGRAMKEWAQEQEVADRAKYQEGAHGSREDFEAKLKLDTKGRMKAFAIADILAKIVGGTALAHAIAAAHQTPDTQGSMGGGHNADGHVGQQVGGEHTLHPISPEVPPLEHVTIGQDTMFTQVMADHVPGDVYSPQYIEMLKLNRDAFAEMFKHAYPNGHIPEAVDVSKGLWNYLSPEQAIANLDKVIAAGYPDPTKMSADAYREALRHLFNAVREVKAGTELVIPPAPVAP